MGFGVLGEGQLYEDGCVLDDGAHNANEELASLADQTALAAKWSMLTQVAAKLIAPVTTMVLARLLAPDVFGVVATAMMVIALAELFADAGFQKYLVQHRFQEKVQLHLAANVAFWSNIAISLMSMILIVVFNESLAVLLGCPGHGTLIVYASLTLPITALSSVQTALFQRNLNFKVFFVPRLLSGLINLVVSVALALLGFEYWSIVSGTIASYLLLAIALTVKSQWKPRMQYSFRILKEMISFGLWIVLEGAATWLNSWAGVLVVGTILTATEVGYYKTTSNLCLQVFTIITASLMPVVYSSLSKVQENRPRFEAAFFQMARYVGFVAIPLGVGCFAYRDLCVAVLLGEQWSDVSLYFGLSMLTRGFLVTLGYTSSEVYRALGKPSYSVLVQSLFLVPFFPALFFSSLEGFGAISVAMPLCNVILIAINLFVLKLAVGISPLRLVSHIIWPALLSVLAMLPGIVFAVLGAPLPMMAVSAFASMLIYALLVFYCPMTSEDARGIVGRLR